MPLQIGKICIFIPCTAPPYVVFCTVLSGSNKRNRPDTKISPELVPNCQLIFPKNVVIRRSTAHPIPHPPNLGCKSTPITFLKNGPNTKLIKSFDTKRPTQSNSTLTFALAALLAVQNSSLLPSKYTLLSMFPYMCPSIHLCIWEVYKFFRSVKGPFVGASGAH